MSKKTELEHLLSAPLEADNVHYAPVLPGGKQLAYVTLGDSQGTNGPPLYAFHGFPSSRYEPMLLHAAAKRAGILVIAADRPGYGSSDFVPDRKFEHWPATVAALADHLGHDRIRILGVSGGGPYAAITAALLPERVTHLTLVCALGEVQDWMSTKGMPFPARLLFSLFRTVPRLTVRFAGPILQRFFRQRPDRMQRLMLMGQCPPDRAAFQDPQTAATLLRSLRVSMEQGYRGPAEDLRIYTSAWRFDPATIQAPTDIWHGELDSTVPLAHSHAYQSAIPNARLHLIPDQGHFSLPVNRMEDILSAMAT